MGGFGNIPNTLSFKKDPLEWVCELGRAGPRKRLLQEREGGMNGWTKELHEIHDQVQDRIALQPDDVKRRSVEQILTTHRLHRKPNTHTERKVGETRTDEDEGETITLTRDLIFAGQSEAGGWNRAQLEAIGITWKDLRRGGWIERNCGRVVGRVEYRLFLSLTGQTKRKR